MLCLPQHRRDHGDHGHDVSDNSASVTVCPTVNGLTIGYWTNKNGQGRINGANQTALATYLIGYAPFADYPTTSGQTIAAYVYNVTSRTGTSRSISFTAAR